MRKLILRLSIFASIFWISINSYSQKGINTQIFDDYFNQIEKFNGNILVAIDGQPIFIKSYGFANLELDVKNTKDEVLISDSTKNKMFTPAFDDIACGIGYGKIKLEELENKDDNIPDSLIALGHGGWVPGFNSHIDIFPEKKILIVKLSNGDYFKEMYDEEFTQLVLNEIYSNTK